MKPASARILLVEDNPSDCEVVRRSITRGSIDVELLIATCGEEAFELLDPAVNPERPDLVFVDLNLPDCDGREIIRRTRIGKRASLAPIVVLTTSDSPRDIAECYELGCNGYLVKPSSFAEYVYVLGATIDYWLRIVTLPTGHAAVRAQPSPA